MKSKSLKPKSIIKKEKEIAESYKKIKELIHEIKKGYGLVD